MKTFYLGIDVGTASARAAVFDDHGVRSGYGSHPIEAWQPRPDHHDQSSDDIWNACGHAVRNALAESGLPASSIRGVGFAATCSLVVLDSSDAPLAVTPDGPASRNVMLWMDHRSITQAARVNATEHDALRFVGGSMSPEMQVPKLLWIKEHASHTWQRAARFLDLGDFLSYRATGRDVRSLCTTTCKWNYSASDARWDDDFFATVGLNELTEAGHERIGTQVRVPGVRAGELTALSANELGLAAGTPVSVSMIDAHAGGIGLIGMSREDLRVNDDYDGRLALIGGTSTCHMALARDARFVPGVWGPYYSAMVPGLWLTEGGQSATGALVDHIIKSHASAPTVQSHAQSQRSTPYEILNRRLADLATQAEFPAALTRHLHIYPDFHGNRSPLADPHLKGMVSGLSMDAGEDSLAVLYLAAIQAIAQGTRHVIETMNMHGFQIETLLACGGGTKNEVFLREHADITGCRIVLPEEPEAVLVGAAMLGAVACGDRASIPAAMETMSRPGRIIEPARGAVATYHRAKRDVYHLMLAHQRDYAERMNA